jgi:hypothetical protein
MPVRSLTVTSSDDPPERRALAFDALELPVPADVLVYTQEEWDQLAEARPEPLGPVRWYEGNSRSG